MTDQAQAAPFAGERQISLQRCEIPSPELSRFFYATVGAGFNWYGRLGWSYAEWLAHVEQPELHTWFGSVSGSPIGYFELLEQATPTGSDVQIEYFGLLPNFIGRGLGTELLADAIEQAWALGPQRIWLHTCTLDHPRALGNYQAGGFEIFETGEEIEELPDEPLQPWPNAQWSPTASERRSK
jgi:ribosomal protein S18 acetylase RimI-like enzyme